MSQDSCLQTRDFIIRVLNSTRREYPPQCHRPAKRWLVVAIRLISLLLLFAPVLPIPTLAASRKKEKISYGEGLIVNIPMAEQQVLQVVRDVSQNGIIRGTKEYNKDEFISGAKAAPSSRMLPWNEAGNLFYKIREQTLDPQNFTVGGDLGTLVVRYVVQAQGEKNTVLRIDAVFAEQYRHTVHKSDGSVESAEYKDIRDHLDAITQMERQNEEALKEREQQLARKQELGMNQQATSVSMTPIPVAPEVNVGSSSAPASPNPNDTPSVQSLVGQSLEDHVKDLRKQVERLVKAPGAPLKSAPFHTASTLDSLAPGAEVLILISTPYWYGVETRKGQRGWIMRDQLEQP